MAAATFSCWDRPSSPCRTTRIRPGCSGSGKASHWGWHSRISNGQFVIAECTATRHNVGMRFGHAGLRRFWERGDASRLNPAHLARIERLLDDLPGLQLHQLTGNRRETWAVRVSGNWRLTFRFEDGQAVDVNLEDYH